MRRTSFRYVGPRQELAGRALLMRTDGGVAAQFNDVASGFEFGWYRFWRTDFDPSPAEYVDLQPCSRELPFPNADTARFPSRYD